VAEWNWGKKTVMVPNPWEKGIEESYDFNITKLDKLFDFLLERGQIKLPTNHVMLPPDQLKNVRKMDPRPIYFGFWCLMTNTTKLD
jgi:hypothetical protein